MCCFDFPHLLRKGLDLAPVALCHHVLADESFSHHRGRAESDKQKSVNHGCGSNNQTKTGTRIHLQVLDHLDDLQNPCAFAASWMVMFEHHQAFEGENQQWNPRIHRLEPIGTKSWILWPVSFSDRAITCHSYRLQP